MSAATLCLYKRFRMPSGNLLEVRRVTDGAHPEVVVRKVDENDKLSPGEFNLTLRFLLAYGREVRRV
jgi:hypothetical protein